MQLFKVGKDAVDIVQGVRTLRMPRQLHALPAWVRRPGGSGARLRRERISGSRSSAISTCQNFHGFRSADLFDLGRNSLSGRTFVGHIQNNREVPRLLKPQPNFGGTAFPRRTARSSASTLSAAVSSFSQNRMEISGRQDSRAQLPAGPFPEPKASAEHSLPATPAARINTAASSFNARQQTLRTGWQTPSLPQCLAGPPASSRPSTFLPGSFCGRCR